MVGEIKASFLGIFKISLTVFDLSFVLEIARASVGTSNPELVPECLIVMYWKVLRVL